MLQSPQTGLSAAAWDALAPRHRPPSMACRRPRRRDLPVRLRAAPVTDDEPSTSAPSVEPLRRYSVTDKEMVEGLARQYTKFLPKGALRGVRDWENTAVADPIPLDSERSRSDHHDASLQVHLVQWYPGHIARAERQLKEQLKMVDVVLEVRDARIPLATAHPQVAAWCGAKPRLLVMNRQDMVSPRDKREWQAYFKSIKQRVFWTDGKAGQGCKSLFDAMTAASTEINAKREARGLKPRPVRACVIGFPNIGKSALINRLLNRKVVDSAPRVGVTRVLKWVRMGAALDLLDAPGVIPASFNDQISAQRLAMCNDIGEASYVDSLIAAALLVRCKRLPGWRQIARAMTTRYYQLDPSAGSAEDFVQALADRIFLGDREKAGARILADYRNGALGNFALELPKDIPQPKPAVQSTAYSQS